MKLINLYFAYQMECLKALCLAITWISHSPVYWSLLENLLTTGTHWLFISCANHEIPLTPVPCTPCWDPSHHCLQSLKDLSPSITNYILLCFSDANSQAHLNLTFNFCFFFLLLCYSTFSGPDFTRSFFSTKKMSLDLYLHGLAARKGSAFPVLWHLSFTITIQCSQSLPKWPVV